MYILSFFFRMTFCNFLMKESASHPLSSHLEEGSKSSRSCELENVGASPTVNVDYVGQ